MFNDSKQKVFRRKLRHNLTYPEFIFWQAVRGKSLGVKFRRQQGFGRYIVDFYASEVRLIVEIDGDSHFSDEEKSADEVRTHFLGGLGMTVLRFTNRQIMNEKKEVLDFLRRYINQLQLPPNCDPIHTLGHYVYTTIHYGLYSIGGSFFAN